MVYTAAQTTILLLISSLVAASESVDNLAKAPELQILDNTNEPDQVNNYQQKFDLSYNRLALGLRKAECDHPYGEHVRMYTCPSHVRGDIYNWPCIRSIDLCNGYADCPNAEDEHPVLCMYYLAERDLVGDVNNRVTKMSNVLVNQLLGRAHNMDDATRQPLTAGEFKLPRYQDNN